MPSWLPPSRSWACRRSSPTRSCAIPPPAAGLAARGAGRGGAARRVSIEILPLHGRGRDRGGSRPGGAGAGCRAAAASTATWWCSRTRRSASPRGGSSTWPGWSPRRAPLELAQRRRRPPPPRGGAAREQADRPPPGVAADLRDPSRVHLRQRRRRPLQHARGRPGGAAAGRSRTRRPPGCGRRCARAAGDASAVIVADTMGRPLRNGIVGTAIGVSGVEAAAQPAGRDRPQRLQLRTTQVAVADELAAAADLVLGKLERVPAALVRGYPLRAARTDGGRARARARARPVPLSPPPRSRPASRRSACRRPAPDRAG